MNNLSIDIFIHHVIPYSDNINLRSLNKYINEIYPKITKYFPKISGLYQLWESKLYNVKLFRIYLVYGEYLKHYLKYISTRTYIRRGYVTHCREDDILTTLNKIDKIKSLKRLRNFHLSLDTEVYIIECNPYYRLLLYTYAQRYQIKLQVTEIKKVQHKNPIYKYYSYSDESILKYPSFTYKKILFTKQ